MYLLPYAKDGSNGNQTVNVGGAIQRVKCHHILASLSSIHFNEFRVLLRQHHTHLQNRITQNTSNYSHNRMSQIPTFFTPRTRGPLQF